MSDVFRDAIISDCEQYRYMLERRTYASLARICGTALFALNNPSVADAMIDDPTALRGWGFTQAWGHNRMVFVNTSPYRSTDPDKAIMPPEAILLQNDEYLRNEAREATVIIAAWGAKANPVLAARALNVLTSIAPVHCLALTKDGRPKHILYLKGDLLPILWKPAQSAGEKP